MNTVGTSGDPSPRQWNWLPFGVAAALLLVSLFSAYVLRLLDTIEEQNRQLASFSATRLHHEEVLSVLVSKNLESTTLEGTRDPVAHGKVMRDTKTGRCILLVSHLPPAPDMTYQLWSTTAETSVSVGLFTVRDTDARVFSFNHPSMSGQRHGEAFVVTLEPAGGSSQPGGDMYLTSVPPR